MKKKKVIRLKKKRIFLLLIIIILLFLFFKKDNDLPINNIKEIKNISIIEDKILLESSKNIDCMLSNKIPSISDKWTSSIDKKCTLDIKEGINNIYIKEDNEIINLTEDKVFYLETSNKEEFYIANNNEIKYINILIGNIEKLNIKSSNEDIAIINSDGNIKTNNKGNTIVSYTYNKMEYKINITSTDLIVSSPDSFDFNKDVVPCDKYSNEESELLDKILKSRIDDAGYNTRAGVVEAARFLTLEFPYKIPYFHENGRQTTNKIDGEGRYYHIGLYLSNSKFKDLTKSSYSPKTWGCKLYSNPRSEYNENGLNCSGFVSWAILNGGFDIGDIGAGFKEGKLNDLTDFGDMKSLSINVLNNNNVKVGDLLHSNHTGGHIAMIIGIKDDYYYVAQAIWETAPTTLTQMKSPDLSVQITKFSKEALVKAFSELILMDKYYKKDGNLTNMW